MHQQDVDSDASAEEGEFNGYIRTLGVMNRSIDIAQLGVVRCTLVQPEQINDWRRTVIFQTCTKIENKSCRMIVNNGNYINAVASKLITTLGIKLVKHPNLYKITWIDTTSIEVQEMPNSHSVCHIHR